MQTRLLPVKLTDEEIKIRGQKQAQLLHEVDDLEIKRKLKNDDFSQRIKACDKQIRELAGQINDQQEWREVQIEEHKDWTREKVDTIRLDTGEVVDTRPMTPQELNRPLPMFSDEETSSSEEDDKTITIGDTKFTHRRVRTA